MRPRFFYLGRRMKRVLGYRLRGCKERGEWAELCFMARAAENGLRVSKPYGESASYDVGVEHKGTILRVQVKSTIYYRRGGSFSLNVLGPKRKKYPCGVLDFFAVYLIPIDTWYIIPFEVIGLTNSSLHFTPGGKVRQKHEAGGVASAAWTRFGAKADSSGLKAPSE